MTQVHLTSLMLASLDQQRLSFESKSLAQMQLSSHVEEADQGYRKRVYTQSSWSESVYVRYCVCIQAENYAGSEGEQMQRSQ
ncbi:unnamed protein product [Sphagnum troendelagicum]|uniref:Uncharacterized protein n=1 Tax=Sphagnum troendelagicum TaxID=128251 RepID=A0ABP0UW28_9BRYO